MISSSSISSRAMLIAVNLHIELNESRFALTSAKDIRQQSDASLVASSLSNPFIEELIQCVQNYCNELIDFGNTTPSSLLLDDLIQNAKIFLSIFDQYHEERNSSVQSLLSSPFREDAWHFINELDLNIFFKCRIILIRLRCSFLLVYQLLTINGDESIDENCPTKKKQRVNECRSVASFIHDRKK